MTNPARPADLMVQRQIEARGVSNAEVLRALKAIPRHEFVPEKERSRAYEDRPLPIGSGQTISQPYIVAFMTELLELRHDWKVLEVGTGSGYQTAVLAAILPEVYSIEIVSELHDRARDILARITHLPPDHLRQGDGYFGWPEKAPFDAIIVTAAAPHLPPPLVNQMKPGGRMVIPLGATRLPQDLVLVEKSLKGEITTRSVLPVSFVPLTGGPGISPGD